MKCPNCNVNLLITDRSGVEIDYCPECRGVWLDRGELDKIIERSVAFERPPQQNDHHRTQHHDYKHHDYRKKKKDSFLGDLFDF
ncbi:zf-TFIIB domain-containing protein [Pedobacter glucosidilyticus]|uniref:TFIIB-type zinc ribbon-containing protein n=1 Tax=Pedobacter glucosidilyticus TaxID=1122941 RepID=UPI0004799FAA|nr:zf-TFIIB domain-containing protein [Pedobacter glucosidilyticus]